MAGKKTKKRKQGDNIIAKNRHISHEYLIEERFEAGLVLEGWEVKSMREGKVQLKESYVFIKNGEVWISGMHISALNSASTHITPFATRVRKLLLHRQEINKLIGNVERKGYTLVPTFLYWKNNRAKLEIALAKGKKLHDKRATEKDRDWQREKARNLKLN
ncbi:SsrA-binding protein [Bathymodiolus japonicus methanotrophic gill symbiont]|uniref:SsrA-binding protein SmpB n=1 Tax=Bathymodiolus japonicus methanotrophic gill symbiont TaxID=113269 RepID=UPI001B7459BD|nr:SsrA-binding protein SmpB [Bathymodiolus japonicus methanotrophic gill symbiont]GFO73110.1 SsrA-binding protein [Bathymodiolus japonicus methanotrophic gill symbiont]